MTHSQAASENHSVAVQRPLIVRLFILLVAVPTATWLAGLIGIFLWPYAGALFPPLAPLLFFLAPLVAGSFGNALVSKRFFAQSDIAIMAALFLQFCLYVVTYGALVYIYVGTK